MPPNMTIITMIDVANSSTPRATSVSTGFTIG